MSFIRALRRCFFLVASGYFLAAGNVAAAPALVWEKETVELNPGIEAYRAGTVVLEGHFTFINHGTEPVEIAALEPDCGCTTAEMTQRKIAPGAGGEVVAKFTVADRVGRQEKHIVVRTKSDPSESPVARLTLVVNLPNLLRDEPGSAVRWNLGEPAQPRTITLVAAFAEMPIERITVASSQEMFQPQIRVVEAGRRYELTVTPTRTDLLVSANLPLSCTFREPDSGAQVQPTVNNPAPVRVYNVTAAVEPPSTR